VYGIVKQSGGHIWVYSELGHGTTFKIYLPSAEKRLDGETESQEDLLPPKREGHTILLAEDDVTMRRLTRKMLEEHGYKVIEADDGNSALAAIASSSVRVDLTLTDVVMKGMTGPELVLRLIDAYPSMKVIYMSGYTGELIAGQGLDSSIKLLEKPFTRAALLKTIDAVLEN
jgi:DNA-binding NtrC family response regulator